MRAGHLAQAYQTVTPETEALAAALQKTPALARALDEQASEELCRKLEHTTVRDLLPHPKDIDELPVVDVEATPLEVAAVMARMHSPVVAVVDDDGGTGRVVGAITASRLLEHLLPPRPAQS